MTISYRRLGLRTLLASFLVVASALLVMPAAATAAGIAGGAATAQSVTTPFDEDPKPMPHCGPCDPE